MLFFEVCETIFSFVRPAKPAEEEERWSRRDLVCPLSKMQLPLGQNIGRIQIHILEAIFLNPKSMIRVDYEAKFPQQCKPWDECAP